MGSKPIPRLTLKRLNSSSNHQGLQQTPHCPWEHVVNLPFWQMIVKMRKWSRKVALIWKSRKICQSLLVAKLQQQQKKKASITSQRVTHKYQWDVVFTVFVQGPGNDWGCILHLEQFGWDLKYQEPPRLVSPNELCDLFLWAIGAFHLQAVIHS